MRKALVVLALLMLLHPSSLHAAEATEHSRDTAAAALEPLEIVTGICAIRVADTDDAIEIPDNMPGTQDAALRKARPSDAQVFELLHVTQDEYVIRTKSSGGYLIESGSESGSPVQQHGEGTYRHENAVWTAVETDLGIGFRNKESNLMMTASDDGALVIEDYDPAKAQSFELESVSLDIEDGWYCIQNPSGKVLDVCHGSATDGQEVTLYPKGSKGHSNKNQRFFVRGTDDETYTIAAFEPDYALDIHVASSNTKGNLHIAARSESQTQEFRFHLGDNGYYEIENVDSGKYLDVNDCSSRIGTTIQQCSASHSGAQQFGLVAVSRPSTKGEDIAHAAVELACSVDERLYADDSAERIYNAATKRYVDAREQLMEPVGTAWEDPPGEYASCDVGVAAAVRYSHADEEFEYRTIINQWPYLREHFAHVGTYIRGGDTSELKPGDILISDTHISIWTGNEAVRERFGESCADLYEAGYSPAYYPSLVCASDTDDTHAGTEFDVFRIEE